MTAKEKAKELESMHWHKLYEIQSRIIPTELAEQAKQCALICVNEVIDDRYKRGQINFTYWKEVEKEINKL